MLPNIASSWLYANGENNEKWCRIQKRTNILYRSWLICSQQIRIMKIRSYVWTQTDMKDMLLGRIIKKTVSKVMQTVL